MRKLTKKYRVHLAGWLLLLALLPVSCIKDDYAPKDKATVTVTFTTRAESETTVIGRQLADNERMKTLRVIVAKGDRILYNEYYEEEDFAVDENNGQRYKTVIFSELVTEDETDRTFVFYAIANEAGIANWPTQITSLDELPVDITLSSSSNLIPQTAKQSITVKIPQEGSGIQKETMQLEFVVAKVSLSFSNETGKAQNLSDVKIVGAKPDKGFLFNDEDNDGTIYVPTDVNYEDITWSRTTISAGTETVPGVYDYSPVYLFPGQNSSLNSGYILTATLNESDRKELKMPSIIGLDRGQELKINIRLYKEAVNIQITLTWEVVDWQKSSNTVPSFD